MYLSRFALFWVLLISPLTSYAVNWIQPNDLHLRADIQMLANTGVITVPVTTYPLAWKGVLEDVRAAEEASLSAAESRAIKRVLRAYNSQQQGTEIRIAGAAEAPRFQHFASPVREQGELGVSHGGQHGRFSYNLAVTAALNAESDETVRLDNTYLAVDLGNWVLSAGWQQAWWGPGWDTALTMSTNARPMPGVLLTRHQPDAFTVPVLKWLGPWTLATGVQVMDDDRYVDNTLLWTFRGSIRPHKNLELGLSRSAQLCGKGRPCDLGTWWDMLVGEDNTGTEEEPGNQLAAIDIRWGHDIWGVPYSLYWETMGEDSVRPDRFPPFQAKSYLYGADISFSAGRQDIRSFIEYTDTEVWCNGRYGCAYEHHLYRSGYRYNKRSLGSTYDNDAITYTLGFIGYDAQSDIKWKVNFRYLDLNRDDKNDYPPHGGNTAAPRAEKAKQFDFSLLLPWLNGDLELGSELTDSTIRYNGESSTDINVWAQWTYQL